MELYTSLTRLKMAMNGGQLPPMTPVPEKAHRIIDPDLTIGLGALSEDELLGLRCPVRGCGEWRHKLSFHLNHRHADIGGAAAVRDLLEIPLSAPLVSKKISDGVRRQNFERDAAGALARWRAENPGAQAACSRRTGSVRAMNVRRTVRTVGYRNMLDQCPRQLAHKLIDLHNQLGRSPSAEEARKMISPGFVSAVQEVYGTWNNAKAQCGLERWKTSRKKFSREVCIEALHAWYTVHGELPSAWQVRQANKAPLLPPWKSILSTFNQTSWPETMRIVASLLDIRGGRFGLPMQVVA